MKKFLLGSALALLSANIASATDLPAKAPAYKAAAPFSWEGIYFGAHGGYGWGTSKTFDATIGGTPAVTLDPAGGFGGLQIGYNSMIAPNWLLGTEIDFSFGDLKDNKIDSGGFPERVKVRDFGTTRVRLGYTMDRSLIYVTGGMAWAEARFDQTSVFARRWDNDHVGWAIGGGYEYAFDPRWSMKLEYIYADFGKWRETMDFVGGGLQTIDLKLSTVKLGINYRFGDPAPSAASMPVKAAPARSLWSGSYVGAHVQYGWSDYSLMNAAVVPNFALNLHPTGWMGGLQAGYNWQFAPNWVFGMETDNSFGDMNKSGLATGALVPGSVKIDNLGTVRARLGYTMDRVMVYATGGLAYARERANVATAIPFTTKIYDIGWTAGGGIEYAIDPRWSAKVEYLYADLGSSRNDHSLVVLTPALNSNVTVNTVKAGLNYKFDLGELLHTR